MQNAPSSPSTSPKALLAHPQDPAPPSGAMIAEAAKRHGLKPFRMMRDMFTLRRGPGKLASHEYFSTGAYHPDLSAADKLTYVGRDGSYEINIRLSPAALTEVRAFVRDKVMYTALLRQLGLPTTETQAVVSARRRFGNITALASPEAVEAFLCETARYPLFAKPCEGAGSVGSALIRKLDREAGLLHLGNDTQVDLKSFCHEIFHDYPEGFLLQSAVDQHPAMKDMTGDAVGTIRVVTLRDAESCTPLYTIWKIPSPTAMSDNFWQTGSMIAEVDETGRVGRCKLGTGLQAEWIDSHPVSGLTFEGFEIPHYAAIQQVAVEAHMLFPEFGILGWDIAVGPDGPVIVECNDNPYHVLWQNATGQGALNPAFKARFDAAAAESDAILKGKIAVFQERQKEKKRR